MESTHDKKFKIDSNMINLVGCNKENFFKLLELMQYKRKIISGNKEDFFVYNHKHIKNKKTKIVRKTNKDSPFDKLSELRFR